MATSQQQQQQQQQQRRVAAGAAAAGAAAAPAAGTAAGTAGAVDIATAPAEAALTAAVLGALVAFLARKRVADETYLRTQLRARAPSVTPDEVDALIAEELQRDQEFAVKASERVARETAVIAKLDDPAERERRVKVMLSNERRYVAQRSEAMAARAFATLDRVVLRQESPQGAFWKLDPTVREHTKGCLRLGGKFWPWEVLDRVHPPRHAGCPCRLVSYGHAIADALMRPGDVLDVRTAVARAAGVMMEAEPDAPETAALQELGESVGDDPGNLPGNLPELRAGLIAAGLTTAEAFDAAVNGRP